MYMCVCVSEKVGEAKEVNAGKVNDSATLSLLPFERNRMGDVLRDARCILQGFGSLECVCIYDSAVDLARSLSVDDRRLL